MLNQMLSIMFCSQNYAQMMHHFVISFVIFLLIFQISQSQTPQHHPIDIISTGEFAIQNGTHIELFNVYQDDERTLLISFKSNSFIYKVQSKNHSTRILNFEDQTSVEFTLENVNSKVRKFHFDWNYSGDHQANREICFHYGFTNASWYSTYQSLHIKWPMDIEYNDVTKNQFNCLNLAQSKNEEFQHILEHMFLNTDGFAIILDSSLPLFVARRFNEQSEPVMCVSVSDEYPYMTDEYYPSQHNLKFHVFASTNIKTVTNYVVHNSNLIPKPTAIPDEHKFTYPSWSTWPYKDTIFQSEIVRYAQKLEKFGFPNSEIMLLNDWRSDQYRDFKFDPYHFPNPKQMMTDLHNRGYRLSLSLNPTVNDGSTVSKDYFFKIGLLLSEVNFTNTDACDWFQKLLTKTMSKYEIDSFVITPYLNPCEKFHNPNINAQKYIETVAKVSNQVSSIWAFQTQHLPVFTQLFLQGLSHQDILQRLIPNVLSVSIAGYSFISSFPIGYPNYNGQKPSEELYIRWVQASTFLPGMTFAVPPWSYANQTVHQLTKKFVNMHIQRVSVIINLAKKRIANGDPIIRPMWYVNPEDYRTYSIDDQFMLGEDTIVAPILLEGQYHRKVYLPKGTWLDQHGNEYNGSSEIVVKAPIEELPYFIRPCGFPLAKNLATSSLTRWKLLVQKLMKQQDKLQQQKSAQKSSQTEDFTNMCFQ